jgi:DNA invertase Pin-like site-specific DNA recombinase
MTAKDTRPLIPYLRQSRAKERTISIDEQRREIQRWADGAGVSLAAEVVEQGVSGSKPWRERALGEAIDACERGEASGIVVAWQDRLSRENGLATAEVWEALDKAGARLVCAAEGVDTSTGDHELTFTIKAAISRDGWKRYRANFAQAQRNAHDRGVPNGRAPLGYRKEKGKPLEIDNKGAAKIRAMAEARIAGEPFSAIARRFGFSHTTTRQILMNDVYTGTIRCGRMVTENAHPAILTREQFEAVNASRTKQPIPPGDTTRDRLLLGLVNCHGCGRTLKVVRRKRADGSFVASYFCKNAATKPCPDRAFVHADQLDAHIAAWFASALRSAPRMVDVVAAARELEEAQRAQEKAQAELHAYVEAASALDPLLFQRGVASRQARVDAACAKVQVASARTRRLPVGGSLIKLWDGFTPAERRDVLDGFLDQIDVRRGASGNLRRHVRMFWSDGSKVTNDEQRIRVAAA